jgi:tetratricopeptide (TPR) repeat protein
MGRSQVKLPHYAFFEALARCENESCAEWRTTSAGLLTLRLFDDWVMEGGSAVSLDSWGLRCVRESISAIDAGSSVRALLTSLVDSMQLARHARVAVVAPRLMAYARALQFDAKWALAADVYRTVLQNAEPAADTDVVIAANMQLGACMRVLAQWSEARGAYAAAAEVAAFTGDVANVLKARIAEANVMMARGNLPSAEKILDSVVDSADENGLKDIRGFALHDRGVVARKRGDLDAAVAYTYEALSCYENQAAKDRALADLAATFFDMGLRDASRDANLVLAATAQENYTRWVAMLNLLEGAALDRKETVFEQYRRALADENLPSALRVDFEYYLGAGYRLFGHDARAETWLSRAVATASSIQANEMLIKAEQLLSEMRSGRHTTVKSTDTPVANPSRQVTEVAEAIHEMRSLAGVSG